MPGITRADVEGMERQYLEPLRQDLAERGVDVRFDHSLVLHLADKASKPGFGEEEIRHWIRTRIEDLIERAEAGEMSQTAPMSWATHEQVSILTWENGEVRIHPHPESGRLKRSTGGS